MVPPLPSGVQTIILSHLLPPNVPLPRHLLAKPLLQRLSYLPPAEGDVDAWLNPIKVDGVSDRLLMLCGTGWEPASGSAQHGLIEYGTDGESPLARVHIRPLGGTDNEGVQLVFQYEGGDATTSTPRGWVFRSVDFWRPPGAGKEDIEWTNTPTSPAPLPTAPSTVDLGGDGEYDSLSLGVGGDAAVQGYHNDPQSFSASGAGENNTTAPADYWAGFSPPPSPPQDLTVDAPGNEDDYWAQYDKGPTPSGTTPVISRRETMLPQDNMDDHDHDHGQNGNGTLSLSSSSKTNGHSALYPGPDQNKNQISRTHLKPATSLLPARIEMKVASLLRSLWLEFTAHAQAEDLELKAIQWVSFREGSSSAVNGHNGDRDRDGDRDGDRDFEVIKGKVDLLREVYGVVDDTEDTWRRLVEGAVSRPGRFAENRHDSAAQLEYWD